MSTVARRALIARAVAAAQVASVLLVASPARADDRLVVAIGEIRSFEEGWTGSGANFLSTNLGDTWVYEDLETGARWQEQIVAGVEFGWAPPMRPDVVRLRKYRMLEHDDTLGKTFNGVALQQRDEGVVALGQGLETPGRDPEPWDPPRLLMPAELAPGTSWEAGDSRMQVAGWADVKIGPRTFHRCVVVESAPASGPKGGEADARLYFAEGVGLVAHARRGRAGWSIAQGLVAVASESAR